MKSSQAALSALLATALLATSLMAAPAAAAPLESTRGAATVEGQHLSSGMGPAWLVAAVIVIALGIVVLSDDDEGPVSP